MHVNCLAHMGPCSCLWGSLLVMALGLVPTQRLEHGLHCKLRRLSWAHLRVFMETCYDEVNSSARSFLCPKDSNKQLFNYSRTKAEELAAHFSFGHCPWPFKYSQLWTETTGCKIQNGANLDTMSHTFDNQRDYIDNLQGIITITTYRGQQFSFV